MIVLVLCVYAAIAATLGAAVILIGFGFAGKMDFWRKRSRLWIILMQVALGAAYMVFINLDVSPEHRWGWDIALICGALGGVLSLALVIPLLALVSRYSK